MMRTATKWRRPESPRGPAGKTGAKGKRCRIRRNAGKGTNSGGRSGDVANGDGRQTVGKVHRLRAAGQPAGAAALPALRRRSRPRHPRALAARPRQPVLRGLRRTQAGVPLAVLELRPRGHQGMPPRRRGRGGSTDAAGTGPSPGATSPCPIEHLRQGQGAARAQNGPGIRGLYLTLKSYLFTVTTRGGAGGVDPTSENCCTHLNLTPLWNSEEPPDFDPRNQRDIGQL